MELYDEFHNRCVELTGDAWCPYPNFAFMQAVIKADDETARKLIEKRRTFLFPQFLGKDPQWDEIKEYLA